MFAVFWVRIYSAFFEIVYASKFSTDTIVRSIDMTTQVRAVEKEFRNAQGEEDVKHMKKMYNVALLMYFVGFAT